MSLEGGLNKLFGTSVTSSQIGDCEVKIIQKGLLDSLSENIVVPLFTTEGETAGEEVLLIDKHTFECDPEEENKILYKMRQLLTPEFFLKVKQSRIDLVPVDSFFFGALNPRIKNIVFIIVEHQRTVSPASMADMFHRILAFADSQKLSSISIGRLLKHGQLGCSDSAIASCFASTCSAELLKPDSIPNSSQEPPAEKEKFTIKEIRLCFRGEKICKELAAAFQEEEKRRKFKSSESETKGASKVKQRASD